MNRVPLCHANAVGWGINLGSVLEGSVFLLLFWIFLNTGDRCCEVDAYTQM